MTAHFRHVYFSVCLCQTFLARADLVGCVRRLNFYMKYFEWNMQHFRGYMVFIINFVIGRHIKCRLSLSVFLNI